MKADFLSTIGYGFIMGILKNYEATNPFVSSTTDAFNRLKPGFEAPVCIVTSLGHKPEVPSRNRTILIGLVRDIDNPKATRFELRAPNPFTNTYLAASCLFLSALDGITYAVTSGKTPADLLAELSKKPGEKADYLEEGRAYRCEEQRIRRLHPGRKRCSLRQTAGYCLGKREDHESQPRQSGSH